MTETSKELKTLDISDLMKLLPHRYPFLLVDKIVDIDGDQSARGIKNVTFNEPHFTGHFPHTPIMPGVLLVEGMAQTAGAICSAHHYTGDPKTTYFMTIDKAKFRKTVGPGDVVEYVIEKIRQKRNIFKFACIAEVNGVKVAEAEISAMMVDRDEQ
ncbi:3-hydroxyacyl-ACP dehydratase FabZ [Ahrensia sp. R2A130]|uniref:3-hydroxyacyl-ACP dehydratase FabZ n=1 Tax=Ahrensia sp. R2A130 TaxID=744979 RepID=UPI0001E0C999|nr:3-hydroxyacyl-ACP dehydratase FabZ [Ahrensia sp. R2A130]EFL90242.1 beta-hydroxyacyl-(acyl-carrier-protein) dehydratase FabZ [Ahrensia sp. R2A130]